MDLLRLPNFKKLELPKFSGDIRDYHVWKKHFTRLVESQYGKDCYVLTQCLDGNARELICKYSNYDAMWARLESEYGDERTFMRIMWDDIRAFKPVCDEDYHEFVRFVEIFDRVWVQTCSRGLKHELDNLVALIEIEKILPPKIKLSWFLKTNSSDDNKVEQLHGFLCHYRKALLKAGIINLNSVDNVENEVIDDSNHVEENKIGNNFDKDSLSIKRYKRCPIHCTNDHLLAKCKDFIVMNNKEKLFVLRKFRACFNCFSVSHKSHRCFSQSSCCKSDGQLICKQKHNRILHEFLDKERETSSNINLDTLGKNHEKEQNNTHRELDCCQTKDTNEAFLKSCEKLVGIQCSVFLAILSCFMIQRQISGDKNLVTKGASTNSHPVVYHVIRSINYLKSIMCSMKSVCIQCIVWIRSMIIFIGTILSKTNAMRMIKRVFFAILNVSFNSKSKSYDDESIVHKACYRLGNYVFFFVELAIVLKIIRFIYFTCSLVNDVSWIKILNMDDFNVWSVTGINM